MQYLRKNPGAGVALLIVALVSWAVGAATATPRTIAPAAPAIQPTETGIRPSTVTASAPAVPDLATSPTALATTATSSFTPTPSATSGPSLAEQVDAAWGAGDWPQVVILLRRANPVDTCKLYSAYYNYGQALLTSGNKANAATQFQNATAQTGCGGEAAQAILALTPSPTPTRTTVPLPTATATAVMVFQPTSPPSSGIRIGAVCNDGTGSNATGSGACSHHGGVAYWVYR